MTQHFITVTNSGSVKIVKMQNWQKVDELIHLSIVSDGLNGPLSVESLKKKGCKVDPSVREMFLSKYYIPTTGITSSLVIVPGTLFDDESRHDSSIIAYARSRGFYLPEAETARHIREKFSDQDLDEMGLKYLLVMHPMIPGQNNTLGRMAVSAYAKEKALNDYFLEDDPQKGVCVYSPDGGFVFARDNDG